MSGNAHEQHLLSAEQARQDLAADLRNMNGVGKNLIRHARRKLKRAALTHGAAALGGLVIGVALGRLATGCRGNVVVGTLVRRAATTFAATLATQFFAVVFAKGNSP